MNKSPILSIIVPLYNEDQGIDYLFERLLNVLNNLEMSFEIICVDDGSKDDTLEKLITYSNQNTNIKIISLSRNFGKEIALTAGLDLACGAAIIPIDADLQDPPERIVEMIEKWKEGYEVVYAVRKSRQGENFLKRFTAYTFYKIIGFLSGVPIPPNTGDFRLLDRKVVEALKKMPERSRFMKGLFAWVGFKQTAIFFHREPRLKGKTSWNYWKLWNFAIDGITSFSLLPLKVWSYLGFCVSFISLIYASFLIIRTLIFGIDVPGYASVMVSVLFLGGIQLLSLGIFGEYLGRIYEEVKQRPLYLVRELHGFNYDSKIGKY